MQEIYSDNLVIRFAFSNVKINCSEATLTHVTLKRTILPQQGKSLDWSKEVVLLVILPRYQLQRCYSTAA